MAKGNPKIYLVFKKLYSSEKEKNYYEAQQKFWLDQNSFIQEKIAKAKEKAEHNSKIEIAKKAIQKGLDNQTIADITGLTEQAIKNLRKKM